MKLSEFKKQLKQLEDKLLAEYDLSDEEVEVFYLDTVRDNYCHYWIEKLQLETMYPKIWDKSGTESTIIELS